MTKSLKIISICLIVSLLPAIIFAQGPPWERLKTPPVDTEDAQNVRIWIGLERKGRCRVTVNIVNSQADTVKHFLKATMGGGYFNYYWDKKDDSGNFVPEGNYRYVLKDCDRIKDHYKLKVQYKPWERESIISTVNLKKNGIIEIDLLKDSALVNLIIENVRGIVIDTTIVDSIMNTGHHEIVWPRSKKPSGKYTARLTVGDYQQVAVFSYKKPKKKPKE